MKESSEQKIKTCIKKSIKKYALEISGNYMVDEYAESYACDLTDVIYIPLEKTIKEIIKDEK
jgi:hypothetical protein